MWFGTAYPRLPLDDNSMFMYLNQMLWFDLITEIFREEGGLIRISEDGGVFPDHPFGEPPPRKHLSKILAINYLNFFISQSNYLILYHSTSTTVTRGTTSNSVPVCSQSVELSRCKRKPMWSAGTGLKCKTACKNC